MTATDRERLVIAGSRTIDDYELLRRIFLRGGKTPHDAPHKYEIVHGDCPQGVDQLAQQYADQWDLPVHTIPADWDTYGDAAGPIRNQRLAEYGDSLIALWDGESSGTENMIQEALAAGLAVHVYQPQHLRDRGDGA